MRGGATITADGRYRYDLSRVWGDGKRMLWIMLNPSVADAFRDDRTMIRVITYTQRDGFDGCVVVNLFALRATNPQALRAAADPIGPDNAATIRHWLASPVIGKVVGAWGSSRRLPQLPVAAWVKDAGHTLWCLGRTQDGRPRHPLYVPKDQPFEEMP